MSSRNARSQIKAAVETDNNLSRRKILQKLFAAWFSGFIYNQIWEDPRVDIQALEISADSRILTISSGGCNALNYLLHSPASVTAVDLNEHHVRLLELKTTAAAYLPDFDSFFEYFGFGGGPNTRTNYYRYIAPNLTKPSRDYWETKKSLRGILTGPRLGYFNRRGLYEHSRNANFLRFFHRFARLLRLRPERILSAETQDEQTRIFESEIRPFFESTVIRFLGKLPITAFGLGIPPQQLDELASDAPRGLHLIEIYKERVRRLACEFPIQENYFAWQAFSRKYDTARRIAIPDYLRKENFQSLKSNVSRLRIAHTSFTYLLETSPSNSFNRFVLLDAQDWMDDAAINQLWKLIASRGSANSRIIFRTAGRQSPIESRLSGDMRRKFVYERNRSEELGAQDRAAIYGGFHIYRLATD